MSQSDFIARIVIGASVAFLSPLIFFSLFLLCDNIGLAILGTFCVWFLTLWATSRR